MFERSGSKAPPASKIRHGARLVPSVLLVAAIAGAVLLFKTLATPAVDVYVDEHFEVDGEVRSYRLVAPRVSSGKRLPIVYAFHGVGDLA